MMNLRSIGNEELLVRTEKLVGEERRISLEVLWHLREIDRRQLFAERGYPNLFEYATRGLGYSDGAASRRIQSMKLLRDVPELERAIQSGAVSLTTASALQNFIRRDEKLKCRRFTPAEKRELFSQIQDKSKRECEQLFASLSPEAALPEDRERIVSETHTEIRFLADRELLDQLQRIRELTAHRNPNPSYQELFKYLAEMALKKLDPESREPEKTPEQVASAVEETPLAESNNKAVPRGLRRYVWQRDHGRCTYVDPVTGKKCDSRFGLQIDHLQPRALGGPNTADNLRLLCASHNRLAAIQALGRSKIEPYCESLRDDAAQNGNKSSDLQLPSLRTLN